MAASVFTWHTKKAKKGTGYDYFIVQTTEKSRMTVSSGNLPTRSIAVNAAKREVARFKRVFNRI